ncbi:MAG: MFS transporter [Verrucomicrobia bacterium]|nr:MFS transporter [Verrucomicrobiota bacterium]
MPYLIFPSLFLNLEYSFLPASWDDASRALFLGVTLAVYPLGQFMGSPILGALSDDYGRKHLLSGTLVIASICNLFTGIAIAKQSLSLLIISRFIAGLMEGNVAIARAMCADLKMLSKHKTFGKINAASSIAYLVGPLFGGVMTDKKLFEELTTSTPFYFICLLFLFLAALSALMLKNTAASLTARNKSLWQRFNFIARASALFSNKTLKILMIISTCFTLAVDIFYEFGPVYLTAKWMLSPTQLVLYNGVLCIGLAIGNGWLPTLISSRISTLASITAALGGFSFLLFALILSNSNLLILIGFALSGLVIGLAVTLLTVKISDSVSDKIQGEVMGTQLSLRVLGDAIICLFGGALLILSPKIILIVAAIISLGTMIYFISKNRLLQTR